MISTQVLNVFLNELSTAKGSKLYAILQALAAVGSKLSIKEKGMVIRLLVQLLVRYQDGAVENNPTFSVHNHVHMIMTIMCKDQSRKVNDTIFPLGLLRLYPRPPLHALNTFMYTLAKYGGEKSAHALLLIAINNSPEGFSYPILAREHAITCLNELWESRSIHHDGFRHIAMHLLNYIENHCEIKNLGESLILSKMILSLTRMATDDSDIVDKNKLVKVLLLFLKGDIYSYSYQPPKFIWSVGPNHIDDTMPTFDDGLAVSAVIEALGALQAKEAVDDIIHLLQMHFIQCDSIAMINALGNIGDASIIVHLLELYKELYYSESYIRSALLKAFGRLLPKMTNTKEASDLKSKILDWMPTIFADSRKAVIFALAYSRNVESDKSIPEIWCDPDSVHYNPQALAEYVAAVEKLTI